MAKLSAAFVRTVNEPGKYGDQHGLILRVTPRGTKQWIWRGVVHGRRRDLGLGGYPYTSLAEARQTAFEYRKLARAGGDPAALHRAAAPVTFQEAAEATMEMHRSSWKDGGRTERIWRSSLQRFVYPRLGTKPVAQITSSDLLAVIGPLWTDKRETARKLKGRIAAVMAWAIAEGLRPDDPTAALTRALPRNGHTVQHQKALPHQQVGDAIAAVHSSDAWTVSKLAFEFLVLTACRSGEVRGARWDEIDLDAAVWTVPPERAKTRRPHRVPLSDRALKILADAADLADTSGLVFPSPTGRPISDSSLSKLLRENDIACVPHGMRSSFRDWCGETGVPREVAEASLAHVVKGVEGAYARSDLLERRRPILEAWSKYVTVDP